MNYIKFSYSLIAWFVCIVPLTVHAQAGVLDQSFGSGGKVITPISPGYESGYGVAIQTDGKIVVAGESQNGTTGADYDVTLVRYNPNGSLDNSFGAGGIVITSVGSGWDLSGSIVLQPDGKIVVAGNTLNGATYDFLVLRYNTDGSLDNSFGTGGIAKIPVGSSHDAGWFCALQTDGKIVVVGPVYNGSNYDFGLVRLNPNGSLDPTFGSGGKVITAVNMTEDFSWSCCLQSDGKILVAGSSRVNDIPHFALLRYQPDGSLDQSFGALGKVITAIGPAGAWGRSVALQTDGKIVLGGSSTIGASDDFALVRYNADGSLDYSFGTNGIITTAVGTGEDVLWAIAIQHDGKIYAAGYGISELTGYDFALARYLPNGSLDPGFGTNGIVLTPVGSNSDFGIALALQSDAKIVMAGASVDPGYNFAVVRYTNIPSTGTVFPGEPEGTFRLLDPCPNPFNTMTQISFQLPLSECVTLEVYDLWGRKVATLLQEYLKPGTYDRSFDPGGLDGGIYLFRLRAGGLEEIRKGVLIR